jgi:hypothetical protein
MDQAIALSSIQMPSTTINHNNQVQNIQIQINAPVLNVGIPNQYAEDLKGRIRNECKVDHLSPEMIPTLLRMGAEFVNQLDISGQQKSNLVIFTIQSLIEESKIEPNVKQCCLLLVEKAGSVLLNELIQAARGVYQDTLTKAKQVGVEVIETAVKTKCFGLCT